MTKKLYTFSYDMFLIITDKTKSTRPPLSTFPLGVGYIESENKNIQVENIYEHIVKTGFPYISKNPFIADYKKPCLSIHPCCSPSAHMIPFDDMSLYAVQIGGDIFIVVNNIRRI